MWLCSIRQRENRTAGTKKHCFCTGCIALLRLYFLCISAIGAILKKEPVSYRIQ